MSLAAKFQLVWVTLFLGVTDFCAAQTNWPQFRGPNASGFCAPPNSSSSRPAPPTTWDVATGSNVLWKTVIAGLGHSCPVIWGDQVFLTTAVNEKGPSTLKVGLYGDPASAEDSEVHQWRVLSLDKTSGKIVWDKVAHEGKPRQKRHMKATHANCTVATDGKNVVAFFGSEGLYCFDLKGGLRWKKDFGTLRISPVVYNDKPAPEGADLEWGFASSPVIHNGKVFIQCDVLTNGFVAALDLADGNVIWKTTRDDTGTWSTPAVCLDGPKPQLMVNGWSHMGGYDLGTGKEIWKMSGGGDCPVPTPLVWEGLVFITSGHGPRRPMYAIRTSAAGDISLHDGASTNQAVAWSALRGGSYMQTPLVWVDKANHAYLYSCHVDGILSCYEARTGKEMYKERLGSGSEGFTASPVASGDKIYFTGENGTVVVVKAGPEFKVLATNQMGEVCMATPAISGGVLFFRTQDHLVAIGGRF